MDTRYIEKRKDIERYFTPGARIADSEVSVVSPSGRYRLDMCCYTTEQGMMDVSRGVVTCVSDGHVIADIKRNYGHFWRAWVDHPDGNEYLLCDEDYQGYSVVNLTKRNCHVYFPEEGYEGVGFCWVRVHPSPDGLVLAVAGCIWACPYDLVLYDFRKPEELPLSEIARFEEMLGCQGWVDDETVILEREIAFRESDGALFDSSSKVEQEKLNTGPPLIGFRTETVPLKRPKFPHDPEY